MKSRISHAKVAGLRAAGASYAQIARLTGMTRRHIMRIAKTSDFEKAKRHIETAWNNSTCKERESFISYMEKFIAKRKGRENERKED